MEVSFSNYFANMYDCISLQCISLMLVWPLKIKQSQTFL
jgi:hypothetical protein